MRILLDENLDWRLERFLPGHEVKSVPRIGWAGLKNSKLLACAQEDFDVLVTMDGSMASQQNLPKLHLAIVALRVIAFIDDADVIRKILRHLGLWAPQQTQRMQIGPPAHDPPGQFTPILTYHPVPDIA